VLARAHGLRLAEGEPAREDGEPGEELCLVVGEQAVRPIDECAKGAVACRGRAACPGQQLEPLVEAGGELTQPERGRPRRAELDGERQPVEPAAQPGDDADVVVGQ
jgi:hypothetical protein